jgi:hypothetical protein
MWRRMRDALQRPLQTQKAHTLEHLACPQAKAGEAPHERRARLRYTACAASGIFGCLQKGGAARLIFNAGRQRHRPARARHLACRGDQSEWPARQRCRRPDKSDGSSPVRFLLYLLAHSFPTFHAGHRVWKKSSPSWCNRRRARDIWSKGQGSSPATRSLTDESDGEANH